MTFLTPTPRASSMLGVAIDSVKSVFDILGTAATIMAIIVGGIWAYFRFVKERTYRPRLEVRMAGNWRPGNGALLFHARVTVKNIGTSDVQLLQRGTGLRLSRLGDHSGSDSTVKWDLVKVFEIFLEHQWIEPGETISDDLLMNIGGTDDTLVLAESRLVWRWKDGEENIVVFARQVLPSPDALHPSDVTRNRSTTSSQS